MNQWRFENFGALRQIGFGGPKNLKNVNTSFPSFPYFSYISVSFSYGQMISSSLIDFCRQYTQNLNEMHSSSWLSSLSNIVGNMFVSDEDCDRVQQIRANNALLLALYEAVHLNRNFITTLSHTHETSSPPSPSNTLNANQPTPDLASAPTTPTTLDVASQYPTNLLVAMFQYWLVFKQSKVQVKFEFSHFLSLEFVQFDCDAG